MSDTIERGFCPGIVGDVAAMHGRYYEREWGFEPSFEFGVARGLCEFFEHYDPQSDASLSIRDDGRVRAFVAISRNRTELFEANLRWFIVDEGLRGRGHGRALIDAALVHCRATGVRRLELFTFDSLAAARGIYKSAGFAAIDSRSYDGWGPTINLERHELRFTERAPGEA